MSRPKAAITTWAQPRRAAFAPPAGAWRAGARSFLAAQWAREVHARRPFLWLPVFFGAGAVLYFAAEREPSIWPPLLACLALLALAWRARANERSSTMRASLAGAFLFAGFAAGAARTMSVTAPVLERQSVARVTAYVETIDARADGARLLLRVGSISGVADGSAPVRVRVNMRVRPAFESGASIAATMRLSPPPTASVPGGYDFARDAYFRQIGAVGNLVSRPEIVAPIAVPFETRAGAAIDRARNTLTERIAAAIGGPPSPLRSSPASAVSFPRRRTRTCARRGSITSSLFRACT